MRGFWVIFCLFFSSLPLLAEPLGILYKGPKLNNPQVPAVVRGGKIEILKIKSKGELSVPVFSRDGSKVAYVEKVGDTARVMVAERDGSSPKLIFKTQPPVMTLAWSPNSQRLALSRTNRKPVKNVLTVIELNSKKATEIGEGLGPTWIDNETLLFTGFDENFERQVSRLRRDGKGLKVLCKGWECAPSPDGRRMVFVREAGSGSVLFQANSDGTGVRALGVPGASPRWVGKDRILFQRVDKDNIPQIWEMTAAGKKVDRVSPPGRHSVTMSDTLYYHNNW